MTTSRHSGNVVPSPNNRLHAQEKTLAPSPSVALPVTPGHQGKVFPIRRWANRSRRRHKSRKIKSSWRKARTPCSADFVELWAMHAISGAGQKRLSSVSRTPSEFRLVPLYGPSWKRFLFGEGTHDHFGRAKSHAADNSCTALPFAPRYFCRLGNSRALVSELGASSE